MLDDMKGVYQLTKKNQASCSNVSLPKKWLLFKKPQRLGRATNLTCRSTFFRGKLTYIYIYIYIYILCATLLAAANPGDERQFLHNQPKKLRVDLLVNDADGKSVPVPYYPKMLGLDGCLIYHGTKKTVTKNHPQQN